MEKIIACIDGTARSTAVCDYAVWSSLRLQTPLQFLHVLDRHPERAAVSDYSGAIGFDAQEHLLQELTSLDEQRSKLAQQHGRQILQAARERAMAAGAENIDTLQRHGSLVETLVEFQASTRLVVLGQHVAPAHESPSIWHIDHHAERVVRTIQRPVLAVGGKFVAPRRFLLAVDGSAAGRKMVETVSCSPLLQGLAGRVVIADEDTPNIRDQAQWASKTLEEAGFDIDTAIVAGEPEKVITAQTSESNCDLLVMGAYGHSRIRHMILGSTTATMLRTSSVPVLIIR
jgi:nucleotide-binding universal stress UspA family protein